LTVGDEILHESGEKVETGARFGAHPDVYLSENAMVSLEAHSHKLTQRAVIGLDLDVFNKAKIQRKECKKQTCW